MYGMGAPLILTSTISLGGAALGAGGIMLGGAMATKGSKIYESMRESAAAREIESLNKMIEREMERAKKAAVKGHVDRDEVRKMAGEKTRKWYRRFGRFISSLPKGIAKSTEKGKQVYIFSQRCPRCGAYKPIGGICPSCGFNPRKDFSEF